MTEPFDLTALNDAVADLEPDDPTAIGSTYGHTDWDNARRLALYEAHNLRYVNEIDEWYRWCEDRWCIASRGDQFGASARVALRITREATLIEDEDDRARHLAHAQASLSERSLRATVNVSTGIETMRTAWDRFDAQHELFNTPNWTFSPRTLDGHLHTRDDMLTQICPTPYVPNAQSRRLDDFFDRFIPDKEEREYTLQILASSALTSGNYARRMILLVGPSSTGKSTLMDLMLRTLGGDYASSVNPSVFRGNLDDKPRPDLLRIRKTRLALAFEANERWELHGDQVKRMTGGDPITARGMRSDIMHEMTSSFTPIIIANTVPSIHDADDALRRRLVALTMDVAVDEADDDHGQLRQELINDENARRALLARLVRTFHECGGRVVAPMPTRFAELTMELFARLDDVDEVLQALKDENSIYSVPAESSLSHCIQTSLLFKCYATWLQRNGTQQQKREQLGSKQFTQRLKSLGYEVRASNGMRVIGWAVGDTNITNTARF